MQHSAVPELAHTRTRPIHWVATAAALAAVVAASAFLQPDAATAAQHGTRAAKDPVTAAPPDPARAEFPLDCGPAKVLVQRKVSGDLDGDGLPETVAAVRCEAGSGTPPSGVYVLTGTGTGNGNAPGARVVATLVDPEDRLSVQDLTLRDATVTATLLGYSSPDVPSCCPDVDEDVKWQWKDGAFLRSAPPAARSM
ncbi:hypothetical protein [Streptomyces beigongshangae]|uniref:hypothetical protein n=1 Tax=Streptomyces beigongshangae TaxID=2841597 RepID=UPI001C8418AB|nr:hypothetical protein [Streptomyces sp. REN17]